MAKLKDYLGSLIAGVNKARVLADLESAKIAQGYAEHNILKHFPVPRFRAQDIELDIPIGIESVDEEYVADYQPIDNVPFNSSVYNVLRDVAKVTSFKQEIAKVVRSRIAESSRKLERRLKAGANKQESFDDFKKEVSAAFSELLKDKDLYYKLLEFYKVNSIEEILERLENKLQKIIFGQIKDREQDVKIEDTHVIVESHLLREMSPQSITRLKIKLVEEGMEWHRTEDEAGNVDSKLLPE